MIDIDEDDVDFEEYVSLEWDLWHCAGETMCAEDGVVGEAREPNNECETSERSNDALFCDFVNLNRHKLSTETIPESTPFKKKNICVRFAFLDLFPLLAYTPHP